MNEMKTIAILGAGTMGNGIAHVCARSGFNVLLYDVNQTALYRGLDTIRTNFAREVAKQKLTQQQSDEARSRITLTTKLDDLAPASLAIEAATERFEIKSAIFRDLDRILPPEAILATNTSSISITRIAAQTNRPEQVIGMHFFNPVPVMKLVELIRGLQTSPVTFDAVFSIAQQLDKTPIEVNDAAGFVRTVFLMPLSTRRSTSEGGVATGASIRSLCSAWRIPWGR
jgi:3-hydroxybutyryl-CoA dehydrogenase